MRFSTLTILAAALVLCCGIFASGALALDLLEWKTESGEKRTSLGRVVATATDGSMLLFQERTGEMHSITPDMVVRSLRDARPFEPMTPDEVAKEYMEQLPGEFKLHKTAHYTILYSTSEEYARWAGILMERLYDTFESFWKKLGVDLAEPEFPLVIVIFANMREYHDFADDEMGGIGTDVIGYYNFMTNRVVCYDLSGSETYAPDRASKPFRSVISEILSRPQAKKQVATIIHEAVHQLAYNRGIAVRGGDTPLWFNEGIALYFESPNFSNDYGWRGIGRVNPFRLPAFHDFLTRREPGELKIFLTDDSLFTQAETVGDAYAEAWALTWFLIRSRPKEYAEYMRTLAKKKPLVGDSPEDRLADFEAAFGPVLDLDRTFTQRMKKVKVR
ncbi:MAG: DUF1570 domain-containing protein [Planctomycetia bacterium]|nr:DUF1570 domain-containing protein [Planctomycetia bacterium]